MERRLEGQVFTHRGRRARNEDTGRVLRLDNDHLAAVVCDGMGGHKAGDYASQQTVERFLNALEAGNDPVAAITAINTQLHSEALSDPQRAGMGTTLVAALVRGTQAWFYNVGDSRGYIVRRGGICEQVTVDHSYVAEAIANGTMTVDAASTSIYKNALTRAIATDATVSVDVFGPISVDIGDTILLCSDGVYKVLADHQLAASVSADVPPTLGTLADTAWTAFEADSDDNLTLAGVWIGTASHDTKNARKISAKLEQASVREAKRRRKAAAKTSTAAARVRGRVGRFVGGALLCSIGSVIIGYATWRSFMPRSTSASGSSRANQPVGAAPKAQPADLSAPSATPSESLNVKQIRGANEPLATRMSAKTSVKDAADSTRSAVIAKPSDLAPEPPPAPTTTSKPIGSGNPGQACPDVTDRECLRKASKAPAKQDSMSNQNHSRD